MVSKNVAVKGIAVPLVAPVQVTEQTDVSAVVPAVPNRKTNVETFAAVLVHVPVTMIR
jgi:hypothetical protein